MENDISKDKTLIDTDSKSEMYRGIYEDAYMGFKKTGIDGRLGFEITEDFRSVLSIIDDFVDKIIKSNESGFTWIKPKNASGKAIRLDLVSYFRGYSSAFTRRFFPTHLQYSENVQLFFDTVTAMKLTDLLYMPLETRIIDIAPYYRMPDGKPVPEDLLLGDLINHFFRTIKETAASRKFKDKVRHRETCSERNFESASQYINSLFYVHSKLLVLRVDFGYREEIARQVTRKQVHKDLIHFLNNIRRNKLFETMKGYVWKLEDGEKRGLHYHFIFFLDGIYSQSDAHLAEQYGNYWVETVTQNRGTYYSCNRHPSKYKYLGIGKIDHYDHDKRAILDQVIRYLTKKDQYLKIKEGRVFGRGAPPKKTTSINGKPLGRPRKYDS